MPIGGLPVKSWERHESGCYSYNEVEAHVLASRERGQFPVPLEDSCPSMTDNPLVRSSHTHPCILLHLSQLCAGRNNRECNVPSPPTPGPIPVYPVETHPLLGGTA